MVFELETYLEAEPSFLLMVICTMLPDTNTGGVELWPSQVLFRSLPSPSIPVSFSCNSTNMFIVNFLCAILFYTMGQWEVLNLLEIVHTFQHTVCWRGWSARSGLPPCSNQREEKNLDPCFPCELWLLLVTVQMKCILVSASLSKSLYFSPSDGNRIKQGRKYLK